MDQFSGSRPEVLGRPGRRDHRADAGGRQVALLVVGRARRLGPLAAGEAGQLHVAPARLGVDLAGVDLQLPIAPGAGEVPGGVQLLGPAPGQGPGLGVAELAERLAADGPAGGLAEQPGGAGEGVL